MVTLKRVSKEYYEELVKYVSELTSILDGVGTNRLYQAIGQDQFDEWLKIMNSPKASTFMIMDDEEVVGMINIRYSLGESLMRVGGHIGYNVRPSKRGNGYAAEGLKLIYQDALDHGMEYVFIDCIDGNIASEKTMAASGAEFLKKEYYPDREEYVIRYKANLKELLNKDTRMR